LERRGTKSESLRKFIEEIGLNKQNITIPIDGLYALNRKLIDSKSDRYSFVTSPVNLKIDDLPKEIKVVSLPIHPNKKQTRKVRVGDIFISKEDFELNKGKEVRLINLYNVKIASDVESRSDFVSLALKKIPKINWVSDSIKVKILMPDGSWIFGAGEVALRELKIGDMVQFERFGFVRYDGKKEDDGKFGFNDNENMNEKVSESIGSRNGFVSTGKNGKSGDVYEFWFSHR
jgi:glutamyl-tRNA synthetase